MQQTGTVVHLMDVFFFLHLRVFNMLWIILTTRSSISRGQLAQKMVEAEVDVLEEHTPLSSWL